MPCECGARQLAVHMSQLLVVPLNGGGGARVGPVFYSKLVAGWALSPDRQEAVLVDPMEQAQRISIGTGAVETTDLTLPDVGSWQRLAP